VSQMIHAGFFLLLFVGMRLVPGAVATGPGFGDVLLSVDPVATALGTDIILTSQISPSNNSSTDTCHPASTLDSATSPLK
jgi:hypothetical protein